MNTRGLRALVLGLTVGLSAVSSAEVGAQSCSQPCVGPPRGAIIAAGGGRLDPAIYSRFVELAGGAEARIVLIPTAGAEYGSHDGWTAIEELRKAGAVHLEVLHTRSEKVADLSAFASPLNEATGVWFSGGRQWRLVDVYLETTTHQHLERLLNRGGIIGGNSAGASALASFLLRGGEFNAEIIATEREKGFGFRGPSPRTSATGYRTERGLGHHRHRRSGSHHRWAGRDLRHHRSGVPDCTALARPGRGLRPRCAPHRADGHRSPPGARA